MRRLLNGLFGYAAELTRSIRDGWDAFFFTPADPTSLGLIRIVTGLLYVDGEADDLHRHVNTVATPLNQLNEPELCPGSKALDKINAGLR